MSYGLYLNQTGGCPILPNYKLVRSTDIVKIPNYCLLNIMEKNGVLPTVI